MQSQTLVALRWLSHIAYIKIIRKDDPGVREVPRKASRRTKISLSCQHSQSAINHSPQTFERRAKYLHYPVASDYTYLT